MQTENPRRGALGTIGAVARVLATAVLSLALGAALCLVLLLGGTSLAAG